MAYPNVFDFATLFGGAWQPTLPISHLFDRNLSRVARTLDAATASTKFDLIFDKARQVDVVGFFAHNFSVTATYRVRAYADASFLVPVFDSGAADVWPAVSTTRSLSWQDSNWWSGRITEDARAGYSAALILPLPSTIKTRYWRVEFLDATNAAGYLQIGRAFFGQKWQPIINAEYGFEFGRVDLSEVSRARSGSTSAEEGASLRTIKYKLAMFDEAEAYDYALEFPRKTGTTKEVVFVFDSDNKKRQLATSMLCRNLTSEALVLPGVGQYAMQFNLEELI